MFKIGKFNSYYDNRRSILATSNFWRCYQNQVSTVLPLLKKCLCCSKLYTLRTRTIAFLPEWRPPLSANDRPARRWRKFRKCWNDEKKAPCKCRRSKLCCFCQRAIHRIASLAYSKYCWIFQWKYTNICPRRENFRCNVCLFYLESFNTSMAAHFIAFLHGLLEGLRQKHTHTL